MFQVTDLIYVEKCDSDMDLSEAKTYFPQYSMLPSCFFLNNYLPAIFFLIYKMRIYFSDNYTAAPCEDYSIYLTQGQMQGKSKVYLGSKMLTSVN